MAKDLTALEIANLLKAPPRSRREVPDGKVRGLFLVLQPTGKASWALRYRFDRTSRKLTLGPYPDMDLRAAREAAGAPLAKLAQDIDPAVLKQATKAAARLPAEREHVETIVARFIELHARKHTREKSARETERILKREIVGQWRGRSLADITRADVHSMLDAICDRGSPVIANRALAAFRKMCAWAVERGILPTSPCDGVKAPSPERSRDRVFSDAELHCFWHACDVIGWPFGPMFKLLVLTGQRRTEVAEMRWREVDLTKRVWTLPKERTKNDIEHIVPLSAQAIAILTAIPRIESKEDFVFTTNGAQPVSGFSNARDRVEATMNAISGSGDAPRWVLHDIRRSVATGLARLGVALPVIEKVLNHLSGSFGGIVAVYQRHTFANEKRHALERWGWHVDQLVRGTELKRLIDLPRKIPA